MMFGPIQTDGEISMPVQWSALGYVERVDVRISARWCLAFAASLGFDGAEFMDDARPGGPAVPPCFCVGPEWILAGGEGRIAALGVTAQERRRAVHALQDSTFHRPFQVDRDATVTARIDEIRQTSAGAYVVTVLETTDAHTGERIVTSRSAVIFRGVAVEGGAPSAPSPTEPPRQDAFTRRWSIATSATLPHIYSECARIWNPIHTERAFAKSAGLPDIILHGTATWGLAMRQIIGAGGSPSRIRALRRFSGRFRAAVTPGSSIIVQAATDPAHGSCDFNVLTDTGDVALSHGLAVFGDA